MIFTFRLQKSLKSYIFYAKDKEDAFSEIKARLGKDAENWSLVSFCEVERFNIFLN